MVRIAQTRSPAEAVFAAAARVVLAADVAVVPGGLQDPESRREVDRPGSGLVAPGMIRDLHVGDQVIMRRDQRDRIATERHAMKHVEQKLHVQTSKGRDRLESDRRMSTM